MSNDLKEELGKVKININDLFESISGEHGGTLVEGFVQFIRFQGCDVGCNCCDTKISWNTNDNQVMTVEEICKDIQCQDIVITGGEPLMQKDGLAALIKYLCHYKIIGKISIETSGAYPIPSFDEWKEVYDSLDNVQLTWVVDYKSKIFGETAHNKMGTIEEFLNRFDILKTFDFDLSFTLPKIMFKIVVGNEQDMELVKKLVECYDKNYLDLILINYEPSSHFIPIFALSPVNGDPDLVPKIINWCLKDNLLSDYLRKQLLTVSLQIHKIVNML